MAHPKLLRALGVISLASGALLLSGALPAAAIPGLTASGTGTVMSQATPLTVPTSNQPEGVAVAGGITYVTNPPTHSVLKFDGSGAYLGDIALPGGSPYPTSIVASSDGSHIFVTDYNPSGSVLSIVTATDSVTAFPVVNSPYAITLSPDGSTFYVISNDDGLVYSYATSNGDPGPALLVTEGLYATGVHLLASPDGTKIYETMRDHTGSHTSGGVRILSATDLTEIGHFDVAGATGLAGSADGTKIWVGSTDSAFQSVVAEFDADGTFTGRSVPVAESPDALIPSSDGTWIYVAGFTNASLDVVDTRDFTDTLTTMTLGSSGLALSGDGLRLYGADRNSGKTDVVSIAKLTLTSLAGVAPGTGPTTFSAQITDGTSPIADYTTNTVKFDILDSTDTVVATATVSPNAAGAASASIDLSALPVGTYSVRATLDPIAGTVVVTAAGFRVSASAGLAATGTEALVPSVAGSALLLLGAVLLVLRRRLARASA